MGVARFFCCVVITSSLMLACTVKTSRIRAISGSGAGTAASGEEVNAGCEWVAVDEITTNSCFGLVLSTKVRPYHESLYYCCPHVKGDTPICFESDWWGME